MKSTYPDINEQIELSRNAIRSNNPKLALEHITQACRLATQHNDNIIYDYARLLVANCYNMLQKFSVSMPIYAEIWDSIENNCPIEDVLQLYSSYAAACGDTGDMKNALYYAYKGIELATEHQLDRPLMGLSFAAATAYDRMSFYSRTIALVEKVIPIAKKLHDNRYLISAYTLYASSLMNTNDKERATTYYHLGLEVAQKEKDYRRTAIILQHLSMLHPDPTSSDYLQLCQSALDAARQSVSVRYTAGALASLGDWYMVNKKPREAEKYYTEILQIAPNADEAYSYWLGHYSLAKLSLVNGDYKTARKHGKAATTHLNKVVLNFQIRDTYKLWYELEKSCENKAKALEWLEKYSEMERRIAEQKQDEIAKSVLIVAHVDEMVETLRKEREIIQKLREDEERSKRELLTLSLELEEKRGSIRKIHRIATDSVKNIKDSSSTKRASVHSEVAEYLGNTENDRGIWERFHENLEQLHPEFVTRLLNICPDLTPMHIRVCCLLRLQMSSKEIMLILHVSKKTVDNHRDAIRKKLGLAHGENLSTYILKI